MFINKLAQPIKTGDIDVFTVELLRDEYQGEILNKLKFKFTRVSDQKTFFSSPVLMNAFCSKEKIGKLAKGSTAKQMAVLKTKVLEANKLRQDVMSGVEGAELALAKNVEETGFNMIGLSQLGYHIQNLFEAAGVTLEDAHVNDSLLEPVVTETKSGSGCMVNGSFEGYNDLISIVSLLRDIPFRMVVGGSYKYTSGEGPFSDMSKSKHSKDYLEPISVSSDQSKLVFNEDKVVDSRNKQVGSSHSDTARAPGAASDNKTDLPF
jgi:hypothetical protein